MDKQYPVRQWAHGADLVVSQLEAQGVRQVFGIPGAKIDKVFDSLLDSSIRIIPVRHEANAAFMAAAVGRITGKAGVALVTSGPGCSNLITGMATAVAHSVAAISTAAAIAPWDASLHSSAHSLLIAAIPAHFSIGCKSVPGTPIASLARSASPVRLCIIPTVPSSITATAAAAAAKESSGFIRFMSMHTTVLSKAVPAHFATISMSIN